MKNVKSDWVKQKEWHGNPKLGLDSYRKIYHWFDEFKRHYRNIPVDVFGKNGKWAFSVDAGPNDDLSYSGYVINCQTADDAMKYCDEKFENGTLIY